MSDRKLLVTGAAGHLGRRVVELLLEQGAGPIVATTRRPDALAELARRGVEVRGADFDDAASLERAFSGVERILIISTDRVERGTGRAEQHVRAVRAAERAGAEHVVYTSLQNASGSPVFIAQDHATTESALAASRLDYTVLRNTVYAEILLGALPAALATGQLVDAKADGPVAWVAREDCARAAAAALRSTDGGRRRLDVTGPEPLTSARLAEIVSRVTGKKLVHVSVPPDALIQGLTQHGVPQLYAELYAEFDVAAARGDFASVSDTIPRLTGKPAQTVEAFLTARRATLV